MDINEKVIIMTGASSGIGRAAAIVLSKAGAKLVLAARSKVALDELAAELPGALAVQTDMTRAGDITRLVERTMEKHGRIDVLVNNAGRGMYGAVESAKLDDYRAVIELNVVAPLAAMQAVIPIMRRQGGGAILNISSMLSKMYLPQLGSYASTKYALNALSHTARAELAKDNIIVSLMLPALTATDFGEKAIKSDAAAQNLSTRSRPGMPVPDSAEYIAGRIKLAIESGEAETLAH
jgi:short-subunit dehydrogenase